MTVKTILFGEMEIPEDKTGILLELERCKKQFLDVSTRYLQCRIDCLEEALDRFRRLEEDV